jgi:hypothetical protein
MMDGRWMIDLSAAWPTLLLELRRCILTAPLTAAGSAAFSHPITL